MTWISGLDFIHALHKHEATKRTLLLLLHNPDPHSVEFGIRGTHIASRHYKKFVVLPVYQAIWKNDANAQPSLDLTYLRQPIILLAVVGSLAEITNEKTPKYHEYVMHQLKKNDMKILPSVILAIGNVGTKKDIKYLIEIAKLQDGEYISKCIDSILKIDYLAGKLELDKLKKYYGPYTRQAMQIDAQINE